MKFKSDLEMWHKFVEFAEYLKFAASCQEDQLISRCVFYHWDNDAFEEYCDCPDISRSGDFKSKKECWKCPFYKEKEVKPT
jgi:hypothetical protein